MRSEYTGGFECIIKKRGFLLSLLCLSIYLLLVVSETVSSEKEVSAVDKIENAYRDISDISGRFIQMSYLKDIEKKEFYEGEFFIKIPSLFRWSYKGKSPQEVIISGEKLIIYQKKEKQVIRSKFVPSRYGQTPIALLGGFGNIRKDFDIREEKDKVILRPRGDMGNVRNIELYLRDSDFPIKKIKITDTADNIIEIELKDVVINSGLTESLFEFKPPKGVNIIEGF
ncbi:MAG: outer membrane lipoprotein chaperone LolA [Thermodesulfovibrionales bacterium]|nr:outer membrane lipoprotein chaperone LolA [Thermodesulfovibrionales bacterium]